MENKWDTEHKLAAFIDLIDAFKTENPCHNDYASEVVATFFDLYDLSKRRDTRIKEVIGSDN
jgi:hypothetical protein